MIPHIRSGRAGDAAMIVDAAGAAACARARTDPALPPAAAPVSRSASA